MLTWLHAQLVTATEPQQTNIAVPEPGLLGLREGRNSVELYSADQRLSPEQARRMMLEPLLSPGIPNGAQENRDLSVWSAS